MSGLEQIRQSRGVPAKRGMRIRYTGQSDGTERLGTIKSAKNGYLMIQLDGDKFAKPFHPTWKIEYLNDEH